MDFAYLVLTFLQRHPRKLLVLLGGRAVDYGVFFFFKSQMDNSRELN